MLLVFSKKYTNLYQKEDKMCGICGFVGFNDNKLLKKMISVLRHRGPDGNGVYTDKDVSLGHTRLSIIDLTERGKQPMSNEDNSIWITYNGEVYNYIELRKELKKNHIFSSDTDTETIIHAYEEYGLNFVKKLRGMFAFALWDSNKKILILARDPMGKKPLYYYLDKDENILIFASEIKAILEAEIERKINNNALLSYLAFNFTLGNQTIFDKIKKVMGGYIIIYDLKKKKTKTLQYWDIKEKIEKRPEEYYVHKLRMLLEESARLRLRSDVPVGAFLSGGIDSSVSVSFARNKVDYDFHTFSVGFESFSELEYAKKVAEYLNTDHHEIFIYENNVIKHFPKITWHYDEPVGDAAIIANYFLSKKARKYVKVVLAGEGGDELFGGYPKYKFNLKYHHIFKIPWLLRRPIRIFTVFSDLLPKPWNRRVRFFSEYVSQPNILFANQYTNRVIKDEEIKKLTGKLVNINEHIVLPTKTPKNPLNGMLSIDCKNLLPEKYLMKADKATMANGVEERLVLLDKEIINFAFSIPSELKIKNGIEKYILRKAAENNLPKDILQREKQGFGVPIEHWIKGEMKDYILQKLEEEEFIKKEFRSEAIKRISDNVKRRKINNYYQATVVWTLFALEEWYERYMVIK